MRACERARVARGLEKRAGDRGLHKDEGSGDVTQESLDEIWVVV